jgi:hypothetical protein
MLTYRHDRRTSQRGHVRGRPLARPHVLLAYWVPCKTFIEYLMNNSSLNGLRRRPTRLPRPVPY